MISRLTSEQALREVGLSVGVGDVVAGGVAGEGHGARDAALHRASRARGRDAGRRVRALVPVAIEQVGNE